MVKRNYLKEFVEFMQCFALTTVTAFGLMWMLTI